MIVLKWWRDLTVPQSILLAGVLASASIFISRPTKPSQPSHVYFSVPPEGIAVRVNLQTGEAQRRFAKNWQPF